MEMGTVLHWHVKEGDEVSAGDVIADIETDKATMELQSFDDGTIEQILVSKGTRVNVGTIIARLAEEDDGPSLIGRWFGSSDDEIAEVRDFSVRLLRTENVINVVTEELEVSEDSSQLTEELLQVINDNLS